MNPHDWFVEHRTAFVVRTLDEREAASFREHLEGCAECRNEVARIERDLAWLPMGVTPAEPRPGLTRRLVEGAVGARRRRISWLPLAAAAALVLFAFAGWVGADRRSERIEAVASSLRGELSATRDTLSIIRGAARVLQASFRMDGHQGGMTIFADTRTHRWNVVVHGLPEAHPGEVYQFWFICDNGMVRGTEVHLTESSPAFMTLSMPPEGGQVLGAALTVEPAGHTGEPRGKTLAHVML
jgi:hypothetical protein